MSLILWLLAPALAERPISYADALQAAVASNPTLAVSAAARDQAQGQLLSARGVFDPLYTLEMSTGRSQAQGFAQGGPFESENWNWRLDNVISGTTATGTGYTVSASLDRSFSRFEGVQRFEDEDGNDILFPISNLQDAYNGNVSATVSQELLRGVWFRYNTQSVTLARQALTGAELQLESQRQETLFTAAEAYWTWVYQDELRRIAETSVEVAEEALRVGRLQVDSGQLAPVEATRLEAALVQARQNALDAENLAEQAANVLLIAMGDAPDQPVIPATEPGDVPPLELDPERAVEVAMEQNLDLKVARQNLETAELELSVAKHATLPSLRAEGTAGSGSRRCRPNSDDVGAECPQGNALDALTGVLADDRQPFLEARGIFTVPLGNRAARGDRDQATAQVWQREQELRNQEHLVAAQVEEQVRALQSARYRMELADANVRLAEETLSAEEALVAAGRTLQKDLLEARTEVDRTKAEAAKARTDYRLAQALLLKLQGQLTDRAP